MKNTLYRLLCLALCAVMLIAMFPTVAVSAAAEEESVRYMVPDENGILQDAVSAVVPEAKTASDAVDYMTRLGKPKDVHWDENIPGLLWFTAGDPVDLPFTMFRFVLYRNGKRVDSVKISVNTDNPSQRTYAIMISNLFEYEFTTGEYYVTITAIPDDDNYDYGESTKSDVWKFTQPSSKYSRPTKPKWSWPVASWSSKYAEGEVEYEVEFYYSKTKTGKPMKIGIFTNYESSMELFNICVKNHGKGYYSFRVRVYSTDISQKGHSAWSAMSSAHYCSNGKKLSTPKVNVKVVAETGNIRVSWNKVSGAEKHRVYRATSKNGKYTLVKTAVAGRTFTDTTAELGKTYYYKVRALDTNDPSSSGVNYSAWSNVVKAQRDLARPEVSISRNAKGDPVVSWETVEGAAKYYVYRATSKTGKYTHVKTAVSARSYTDTSAKAGKVYYYKVKAVHKNTASNSALSTPVYIRAK